MKKYKIEALVKLDFLARSKLKREFQLMDEKLTILMPKFVIERMQSYKITSNFLADDAGEVTILFCDISNFDDVMKEKADVVISVLDDIFRMFDNTCKLYGVQKIETVGKTYMAVTGLKFLEDK